MSARVLVLSQIQSSLYGWVCFVFIHMKKFYATSWNRVSSSYGQKEYEWYEWQYIYFNGQSKEQRDNWTQNEIVSSTESSETVKLFTQIFYL